MSAPERISRREALALIWFPFFPARHIALAGARYRILRNGHSRRRYLLIHGDEASARSVLAGYMQTHDGIAYLAENHTREVVVEGLKIDPNRWFSRVGAEASLRKLNAGPDPAQVQRALAAIDRGRERLVRAFTPPRGGVLVALHNNSSSYSVEAEAPISDRTSLKEPDNPHAFFLCTDPKDFAVLAASPYNVVLQQKAPPSDDGSLSRLAAARGFRYVNLEVRLGHPERQREMLWWLDWNLK
ncbi:MAG: hypothetical protein JST11_22225 [Acidobacteria bacterium]|nr:hypothetical protein [Acidobacteriota bacterium]